MLIYFGDFPGGPVAKTLGCQCLGLGFNPCQGTRSHMLQLKKILHGTMKIKDLECFTKAPLSMGFPRQEYWSRLPFLSPGDLPNPGIKPESPALQADSLPSDHQGSLLRPSAAK